MDHPLSSIRSSHANVNTSAYTDLSSLNAINSEENKDVALQKVAKQFESLFMHELLKNMRNANSAFEENNLFDNKESNFFRDMYDQQLSVTLSERGMGLSDVLYRQMQSSYGRSSDKLDKASNEIAQNKPTIFDLRHTSTTATRPSSDPKVTTEKMLTPPLDTSPPTFTSADDFVNSLLPMAKKAADVLGLDPLIMIAQSALETGWGKKVIKDADGSSSNNFFNIKADKNWKGDKVAVTTLEFKDGLPIKENAYFKKYEDIEASVNDFLSFITNNPRYQQAISVAHDGKQFIESLQHAGYATDPAYASKILSVFKGVTKMLSNSRAGTGE